MVRPEEVQAEYVGNLFGLKQPKQLNRNLHKAKRNKNDEFYTQISDIERELSHYRAHFKDKVVLCNCDDPDWSAFTKFFALNFDRLKLKKVISTHYEEGKTSYKLEITHQLKDTEEIRSLPHVPLLGDGDFRSEECIELLKQADIVCTNPPFSLFREYIAQLVAHEKKFLIIGSFNAVTYKEIFPLIRDDKLWLGHGFKKGNAYFSTPYAKDFAAGVYDEKTGLVKFRNVVWFTNMTHKKRYEGNEENYPTYDNYDAINIDKTKDIPMDYTGIMGVPISFLDKYNPDQFEIMSSNDCRKSESAPFKKHGLIKDKDGTINGKPKYVRIVIRKRDAK